MKCKILTIFALVLSFASLANLSLAEELKAGDSISLTSDESTEVTDKVRKQIEELSKGILNGDPQFSIIGKIDKVEGGNYFINGDSFIINEETVVIGDLKSDSTVEIRGSLGSGKPKVATQVTVAQHAGAEALPGDSTARGPGQDIANR